MKKIVFFSFTLLLNFSFLAQDLKWAKGMTGSGSAQGYRVYTDSVANVYTIGEFKGTVDFDPGSNALNLTASINIDYFITKMDSSGNLLWAKQLGGADESIMMGSAFSIAIDNSGNVYASGSFTGSVDFDPGPGSFILSTSGIPIDKEDFFVLKLDNSGNFMWAKSIALSNNTTNRLLAMAVDAGGDIYLTGEFWNTVDFDSGPNVVSISGNPLAMFVCKFNNAGNFLWVKRIGNYLSGDNGSYATGYNISIDAVGKVCIIGQFHGNVDFDPGINVFPMSITGYSFFILKLDASGNFISCNSFVSDYTYFWNMDINGNIFTVGQNLFYNLFITKHDATGHLLWTKIISANQASEIYSISLSQSGNIYIAGTFSGTIDFDPSIGINNLSSLPKNDGFICKLNNIGDFMWAKQIGGPVNDYIYDIVIDAAENIYTTGFYKATADFDPDTSIYNMTSLGSYSAFTLKLKKNICSDLTLRIDTAARITCNNPIGFTSGHAFNGSSPYNYSWNTLPQITSPTATVSTAGIYGLTVTDANNCSKSSSVTITAPSLLNAFNLNTNLISAPFKSGFAGHIWLNAYNDGCIPATGKLKLVLDPKLIYNNSVPPPTLISLDTLIWDFNNLTYDSTHIKPHISVTTPSIVTIGDSIRLTTIITPITGDIDTINNIKKFNSAVISAYDPNDKQVFPKGKCKEGYVLNNQMLTYTIRFQNTGNTDATNITVLDELDKDLNINTLKIIGYSHPVYAEISENNNIQFHFKNIHLADSSSNESQSHGYVIFEVTPTPSLTPGSEIKNKVGIYFDFNPAVMTNEVTNTITDNIPESCNVIIEKPVYQNINIYPNPTNENLTIELIDKDSDVEIINLMGQIIYKINSDSKNVLIIDLNYNSGIYFVKIMDTLGQQQVFKVIKN